MVWLREKDKNISMLKEEPIRTKLEECIEDHRKGQLKLNEANRRIKNGVTRANELEKR